MKVLHFADLHLDTPFRWAAPAVAAKRRQALRDTLGRILGLVGESGANAILCAGDLYEQECFSPDTAEFLRAAFADVHPLPIYIAPGNHDWLGPASLYQQVKWSPNVHVFRSDRLEAVELDNGITLWGAAHRAPANTDGFLKGFSVDRGGINLALFHGSDRGSFQFQGEGKAPHAQFDEDQIRKAGLHHAFVGHYHVPKDAELFTYPGNPDPLAFGESGERGVVIATVLPNGSLTRSRRRVGESLVHDFEVDVTGCASNQDVREAVAARLAGVGGVARVTFSGELAADIEIDVIGVAPQLDALLARRGVIHAPYNFDALSREQTVRGQLVRDVQESGLSEERKRKVLVTALRALAGRRDLEVG